MDTCKSVTDRIKKENLQPHARGAVLICRAGGMLSLTLLLIAAGIAAGILLDDIREIFGILLLKPDHVPMGYLFGSVTLIWMAILLLFVGAAYMTMRALPKGYRLRTPVLFAVLVVIASGIGIGYLVAGLAEKTETALHGLRPYEDMRLKGYQHLRAPEKGMLIGTVIQKQGSVLTIKDPRGDVWNVYTESDTKGIALGDTVAVVGHTEDEEQEFTAERVRSQHLRGALWGKEGYVPAPMQEIYIPLRMKGGKHVR